ncbi:SDR family oxidoreductase [Sphingobium sp. CR2-8]|uniref:SDR family oxidoreductase n=1 Tax=Sphingobium sp. CR2-8 TaxID=1306534 RepID=UPI002DBF1129|nr:SDR family oxidoreductase [Sphingobium sp. CR2-8]MEC3909615.1 SDR family oxidoreductase [Sphingobium sp. CR2-8]
MQRLDGKTALITGGTTGIGFASARRFIAEGARIAITGQNADRLAAAVDKLGGEVVAIQADASKLVDVRRIADEVDDAFGGLDIAFLNAGTGKFQSLADIDEETFDAVFAVNVKAVLFGAQSLSRVMRDGGSMIVTTSVNNQMGMLASAVYAASKGASSALVRVLAGEFAARGIRVNSVSPGPIQTEMGPKLGIPDDLRPTFLRVLQESVPMKRIGQAEELAAAVAFLASDDASYINAIELIVDGGWTGVKR